MPAITHRPHPSDPVGDIVAGAVAEVEENYTLVEVAEELAADEIGVVLVRDAHGVVGLLSERDLVAVVAAGRDPAEVTAADVMTTDLVWTHPSTAIRDVGVQMRDAGIRHLPVGDRRNAVGVVSVRDVLAVLLANSG